LKVNTKNLVINLNGWLFCCEKDKLIEISYSLNDKEKDIERAFGTVLPFFQSSPFISQFHFRLFKFQVGNSGVR
jgi:hypothetical protein